MESLPSRPTGSKSRVGTYRLRMYAPVPSPISAMSRRVSAGPNVGRVVVIVVRASGVVWFRVVMVTVEGIGNGPWDTPAGWKYVVCGDHK